MSKYIKYGFLMFAVVLSLTLSSVIYAEDSSESKEVEKVEVEKEGVENEVEVEKEETSGIRSEFRRDIREKSESIKMELKENKEENKLKRDEFREEVKNERGLLKETRIENKTELQSMIEGVKAKREEFKKEMEINKEIVKQKIETAREAFKLNLEKIKDEKKKVIVEKIVTNLDGLNTKITGELSSKVDQIEGVLISIQSRITKAEAKGIDVTTTKAQLAKAELAIETARGAISLQSKKIYTSNLGDETKLKAEMQTIRDAFKSDIKIAFEKVKLAHQAVRDTATTLAQTPKINDIENEVEDKVEEKTETTTN